MLLHVARNADDFAHPLTQLQMAAEGVAVEVLPGKTLAHHDDRGCPRGIGIAEGAAGNQGDAHGFEVGRGGIDELARVRFAVGAIHGAKSVVQRALIRQRQRHGGGLDSWNAPHAL